MLSKTEIEFLKRPNGFNADYAKVLRSRIKSKVRSLREEIALLENAGITVTENCNLVTENRNHEISSNQAALTNLTAGNGAPAGIRTRVHGSRGRYT
jgi:hypothetical protein